MERTGWARRSLSAAIVITLTLAGCATSRGVAPPATPATDAAEPTDVTRDCGGFAKRFGYAEKSVAGRAAVTAILTPLGLGLGVMGLVTLNPQGLALVAAGGDLAKWTAQAGRENAQRAEALRQACATGGGPDTVLAGLAVRDLARVREAERSTRDAVRLYRDSLAILERAGAGDSEDAANTALALAGLLDRTTPADPEIGELYERALRIREAQSDAGPRAAADERHRAASVDDGPISSTKVAVGESCAPASINALDQPNQDAAPDGRTGGVVAVDCGPLGQSVER